MRGRAVGQCRLILSRSGSVAPCCQGVLLRQPNSITAVTQQQRVRSKITDPYADGKYEHPDGSPIDITSKLTRGGVGGGSKKYARNYDNIFGGRRRRSTGDDDSAAPVAPSATTNAREEADSAGASKLQAAFHLGGPEVSTSFCATRSQLSLRAFEATSSLHTSVALPRGLHMFGGNSHSLPSENHCWPSLLLLPSLRASVH
jgi:hypothetical protein